MVGATIALLLRGAEAPARTTDVLRGETVPAEPWSDLPVMSSEAAEHGDDGPLVENTTTQPRSTPGAAAGVLPDVSPLARRIIEQQGIDVAQVKGSGPAGRVIRADLAPEPQPVILAAAAPTPAKVGPPKGVPFETVELSAMRRTTARQLTESKRQVPHIYMTVDVALDALLALSRTLNSELDDRGIRLSVNDMLIKAQGAALMEVPSCNVQFTDDALIRFGRADIAVTVSIPGGLISPIVTSADGRSLSAIAAAMTDLASRARDGNLQPAEYQGGTAGLSNMGIYGIKQFAAIINPPQAMILAVGAGERQVRVVDGEPAVATVMSVTGSCDHRAIDGADGATFMTAFKRLVENPLTLVA